jgi:hypothetical protein
MTIFLRAPHFTDDGHQIVVTSTVRRQTGHWPLDGYEWVERMTSEHGWRMPSAWGADGWDLGSWPLTACAYTITDKGCGVATYCEGDVELQWFETKAEAIAAVDAWAAWHWQHGPNPLDDFDPADPRYRGPFTMGRT